MEVKLQITIIIIILIIIIHTHIHIWKASRKNCRILYTLKRNEMNYIDEFSIFKAYPASAGSTRNNAKKRTKEGEEQRYMDRGRG